MQFSLSPGILVKIEKNIRSNECVFVTMQHVLVER